MFDGFDFPIEPWIVGDPMTLGLAEETEIEEIGYEILKTAKTRYGRYCTVDDLDSVFQEYGLEYWQLPQYLKDEFNYFELEG